MTLIAFPPTPAGPLYQRRKTTANGSPGMSMRRVQTSSGASDHSSQSGLPYVPDPALSRSPSSRRKVAPLEEKPLTKMCGHNIRRSSFQAFGVVISLARMVAYGLAIGGLGTWPGAQAGVCLGIAVLYLIYLRFTVPYSRRDEMALEYWISLLDIILFALILVLSVAVSQTAFSTIDSLGIGLIVVQCLGFASYLINRGLIIVHAFSEVVCPACTCGVPSPRKSRRRSRSRSSLTRSESLNYSMSDVGMGTMQPSYSPDGKAYYLPNGTLVPLDGSAKEVDSGSGSDPLVPEGAAPMAAYMPPQQLQPMGYGQGSPQQMDPRSNSRSSRSPGNPGMFPSIAEETDSQVSSPVGIQRGDSGQLQGNGARSTLPPLPPLAPAPVAVANGAGSVPSRPLAPAGEEPPQEARGQNAVFDKFWKSL